MKKYPLLILAIFFAGFGFAQPGPGQVKHAPGMLDTMDAYGVYITYESQGCFHHKSRLLEIRKGTKQFIAKLYSINPERVFTIGYDPKETTGTLLDSVLLSAEQVMAFRKFEHELKEGHKGGCTTQETYRLQNSSFHIDAKDNTCAWNGFNKLASAFFGEDK